MTTQKIPIEKLKEGMLILHAHIPVSVKSIKTVNKITSVWLAGEKFKYHNPLTFCEGSDVIVFEGVASGVVNE